MARDFLKGTKDPLQPLKSDSSITDYKKVPPCRQRCLFVPLKHLGPDFCKPAEARLAIKKFSILTCQVKSPISAKMIL